MLDRSCFRRAQNCHGRRGSLKLQSRDLRRCRGDVSLIDSLVCAIPNVSLGSLVEMFPSGQCPHLRALDAQLSQSRRCAAIRGRLWRAYYSIQN